ncbi:MAG TPA: hypothetical protein VG318_08570 [Actinomycetota bacterium]|nr:hypothetical protein [Actinomycetota bacterium]
MKILRLTALALALMLFAAACGGGDDDTDTDAGAQASADPHAEHMAFCESVVAAETAVLEAASGGDPAPVEGLVAKVEETAPEELQEQITVVVAGVREALETKDDSAFQTEEFSRNEEEVDQWVSGNCGFESVPVTAVDYAFEGVPETLPAGFTAFNFTNAGEEVHEMIMVRYKDESLTIDDLMKLSDKEAEEKLVFLGASFGPPGASDTEIKELEPGKYALVCFVPVGSTSEKASRKADGPPHVARGMSAEFTVE